MRKRRVLEPATDGAASDQDRPKSDARFVPSSATALASRRTAERTSSISSRRTTSTGVVSTEMIDDDALHLLPCCRTHGSSFRSRTRCASHRRRSARGSIRAGADNAIGESGARSAWASWLSRNSRRRARTLRGTGRCRRVRRPCRASARHSVDDEPSRPNCCWALLCPLHRLPPGRAAECPSGDGQSRVSRPAV
jgi:hypothetical protein